jgi:hypothetical protein
MPLVSLDGSSILQTIRTGYFILILEDDIAQKITAALFAMSSVRKVRPLFVEKWRSSGTG